MNDCGIIFYATQSPVNRRLQSSWRGFVSGVARKFNPYFLGGSPNNRATAMRGSVCRQRQEKGIRDMRCVHRRKLRTGLGYVADFATVNPRSVDRDDPRGEPARKHLADGATFFSRTIFGCGIFQASIRHFRSRVPRFCDIPAMAAQAAVALIRNMTPRRLNAP
jgi:hypothetical protein